MANILDSVCDYYHNSYISSVYAVVMLNLILKKSIALLK
jgi:hypothetical protein